MKWTRKNLSEIKKPKFKLGEQVLYLQSKPSKAFDDIKIVASLVIIVQAASFTGKSWFYDVSFESTVRGEAPSNDEGVNEQDLVSLDEVGF